MNTKSRKGKPRWQHGMTNSPTWRTWRGMKLRCLNKKATGYERYGARGINVCERWLDFKNFLDDMGVRPEGKTLDRIDPIKGYCKENCRWATRREQCANRKNNVNISYRGVTKNVAEWARTLGIKHVTLKRRIRAGWGVEQSLTQMVPKRLTPEVLEEIQSLRSRGFTVRQIALTTGLCKSSIHNALKALQKITK